MHTKDRFIFEQQTLENGIVVYTHATKKVFTSLELSVPIGSAHGGIDDIPNGAPHLLEHLLMGRSKRSPEQAGYERIAGLEGATVNAHTRRYETVYELSAPNKSLKKLLPLFFSVIFEPDIRFEDIKNQSGIIANERQQQTWWPAETEIGQYEYTKWQDNDEVGIERLYGNPATFDKTSVKSLESLHLLYASPGIHLTSVGSGNLQPLIQLLKTVNINQSAGSGVIRPIEWVNRKYHVVPFYGQSTYELTVGGFNTASCSPKHAQAMSFFLRYLTNSIHGPLWQWLRHDLGMVYGIEWNTTVDPWAHQWVLRFNMSSMADVEIVRSQLWQRVEHAFDDTERLVAEVRRRTLINYAYLYEMSDDVLDEASNDLAQYGRIVPEAEWQGYLEACAKPAYLRSTLRDFFKQSTVGSFCAIPKEE